MHFLNCRFGNFAYCWWTQASDFRLVGNGAPPQLLGRDPNPMVLGVTCRYVYLRDYSGLPQAPEKRGYLGFLGMPKSTFLGGYVLKPAKCVSTPITRVAALLSHFHTFFSFSHLYDLIYIIIAVREFFHVH